MAISDLDPFGIVSMLYQWIQIVISWLFSPTPPSARPKQKPLGKVAVIGAGITGVSSAAHLISCGFDVVLFDSAEDLGGIWAKVNETSGLQISSIMYRWHPSVIYTRGYPKRDEILDNVKRIWKTYELDTRTRFKTEVKSVKRHQSSGKPDEGGQSRWIINGDASEVFDGLIVATGTCGKPKMLELPNQEKFMGKIVHSSHLDGLDLKGKKVLIVGGGASGIEALELAVEKGAQKPTILARSDKWIIPRWSLIDALFALQPFGRETYLSWIPELLLRRLHYRDLEEKMAPKSHPFFSETPIVNSDALQHIREGKADYIRGDVLELNGHSIKFNRRKRGTKAEDKGQTTNLAADIIVVATGFELPTLDFLPKDLFPEDYVRPNLYLQNFSVVDTSVCCTNACWVGAVGTVGHYHIGQYARIFAVFLADASTRPKPRDARLWVDGIRWIKEGAPGGALSFYTYSELTIWVVLYNLFRVSRWKYTAFVIFGLGEFKREADDQGNLTGKPVFRWSIMKTLDKFIYGRQASVKGYSGAVEINGGKQVNGKKH